VQLGIIFAVVIALVLWVVVSYNRLVGLRNQVANGWRQIDVQLKRRHDLIPNLVNAVRGAMDFERDTLMAVIDARAKALTASGPADAAQKEGQLTQALGRLFALAENYPTLKANENVKLLQEELASRLAENTGRNLYVLSILTAVLLPMTLITGVYGINVAHLPGACHFPLVLLLILSSGGITLWVLFWRRLL